MALTLRETSYLKGLVALASVFSIAFLFPALTMAGDIEVGDTPPDYLGKSTDKTKIYLSESVGRLQIVSFWATWCGPCLKELPVLNAIQNQVGKERIRVVAINLEEPPAQFRRAMRAYKDYSIIFVHDRKGTTARNYGVEGIPFMVIVDIDGTVAHTHSGYDESALDGIVLEINQLLLKNNLAGQSTD